MNRWEWWPCSLVARVKICFRVSFRWMPFISVSNCYESLFFLFCFFLSFWKSRSRDRCFPNLCPVFFLRASVFGSLNFERKGMWPRSNDVWWRVCNVMAPLCEFMTWNSTCVDVLCVLYVVCYDMCWCVMHAIVDLFFILSCSILVPILIAKYRVIMMKCQIRNREFGAVGCIIYNFLVWK